jgi:polyhydroxyalkanoate synthesis regulator phasin
MRELAEESIDKPRILQRLRQVLKPKIGTVEVSKLSSEAGEISEADSEDMALLAAGYDIYNVPLTSARKLGSVIIGVKSLLRKLLRPSLEQQVIYNSANTRVVQGLLRSQQTLKQDLQGDITNRFEEVMNRLEVQSQEIDNLKAEIAHLKAVKRQNDGIGIDPEG